MLAAAGARPPVDSREGLALSFGLWIPVALLILVGLALVFTEIIIPSFGLITLAALGCFGGALYMVYDFYGSVRPVVATSAVVVALVIVDIILAVKYLPRSPMVLRARSRSPKGKDDPRKGLVGRTGTANTQLRPSGKIAIGGVVYDAESDHGLIEKDTPIRVVEFRGGRLMVRPAVNPGRE